MRFVRDLIKAWLLRRDIILSRPPGQFDVWHVKLSRARDRGLKVNALLDGGAHVGQFTQEFKIVYPDAQVLMVEPRAEAQAPLNELAKRLRGLQIAPTVLGAREGTIEFHESGAQSSLHMNSTGKPFGRSVVHPITTIDKLIESIRFPWPDLIKLDLQGAELDALRGAPKALENSHAALIEVSFIEFQKGQALAADIVTFLDRAGFQLYDIVALGHRPLDGALAQGDFLFVKKTSPLIADHRWSPEASWT